MRVALWNDSVKSAKLLVLFCHLATFLAIARLLWGTRDGPYLGLWFRFTEVFLINALAFQRHSVAWYVATYSRLTYHECIQDPAPDRYLFLGLNPKACSPDRMNQWMEWSFSMDVQTKPNFSQCSQHELWQFFPTSGYEPHISISRWLIAAQLSCDYLPSLQCFWCLSS